MLEQQSIHETVINEAGAKEVKRFDRRAKMWVTLQFISDSEDDRHTVERAKEITVQALTSTG